MARNRDELKKGLPKLESMLIDFLLDSGIGPKHIKGNIVLQYAPKIQELCDSITKIRQTALKEIDGGSETPNGLEEAAEKFAVFYDQGTCDGIAQDCFKSGAKWDREQMMREAVEGLVILRDVYDSRSLDIDFVLPENLKIGDKVRVIVVKE